MEREVWEAPSPYTPAKRQDTLEEGRLMSPRTLMTLSWLPPFKEDISQVYRYRLLFIIIILFIYLFIYLLFIYLFILFIYFFFFPLPPALLQWALQGMCNVMLKYSTTSYSFLCCPGRTSPVLHKGIRPHRFLFLFLVFCLFFLSAAACYRWVVVNIVEHKRVHAGSDLLWGVECVGARVVFSGVGSGTLLKRTGMSQNLVCKRDHPVVCCCCPVDSPACTVPCCLIPHLLGP